MLSLFSVVATSQRDSLGGAGGAGKALTSGDELPYEAGQSRPLKLIPRRYLDSYITPLVCDVIIRNSDNFDSVATDLFLNQSYTVTKEHSRLGYRLDGQSSINSNRPRYSVPVPLGGVQIPPSGQPIVLMRDHQSLGLSDDWNVNPKIAQPIGPEDSGKSGVVQTRVAR